MIACYTYLYFDVRSVGPLVSFCVARSGLVSAVRAYPCADYRAGLACSTYIYFALPTYPVVACLLVPFPVFSDVCWLISGGSDGSDGCQ